jgi:NACalpha-BTF3-like transcription factor
MYYATIVTVDPCGTRIFDRFETEEDVLKFMHTVTRFDKDKLVFTYPTFYNYGRSESESSIEDVFVGSKRKNKDHFRNLSAYQFASLINKYHNSYVFYGWIGTDIIPNSEWDYNPKSLEEAKELNFDYHTIFKENSATKIFELGGILEADIKLVMDQGNCTHERAVKSLKKHGGDIVNAIIENVD